MSSNPQVSSSGLQPGAKLDKYDIVELIGQGGISLVWKGHDPLLDRFVAIKQISLEGDAGEQETLHENFRSEAAIQKKTASGNPHLVDIIDFIDEPRGLFIVMEYVDGVSLEQMLTANPAPMDQRQALGIVAGVAVALDYLHKNGVVHRDLKPANILIPREGGVKICDFGLAAMLEDQNAMNIGTVRYMAPECFSGDKVDPKADIYSLGLIAYEMLAGRDGFSDAFKLILRDQQNQALRWMKWHTNARVSPPELSTLHSAIPQTLADLVARMMEKDPVKRISSAEELIAAIRRHFANPQAAATASTAQMAAAAAVPAASANPTAKLKAKSKLPLILGAILLSQVVILGGYYLLTQKQATAVQRAEFEIVKTRYDNAKTLFTNKQYARAQEEFQKLSDDPKWGNGKLGKSSSAMALWASAEQDVLSARLLMDNKKYDDTLKTYEQAFGKWTQLKDLPELQKEVSVILKKQGETGTRVSTLQQIAAIQKSIEDGRFTDAYNMAIKMLKLSILLPQERARVVELRNQLETGELAARRKAAYAKAKSLYYDEGKVAEALKTIKEAPDSDKPPLRDLRKEILRDEDYKNELALADAAIKADKLDEAIDHYERAGRIKGTAKFDDKIQQIRATLYMKKAKQAEADGRFAEAAQAAKQALKIIPDLPDAITLLARQQFKDDLAGLLAQGEAAFRVGAFEEAIKYWTKAQKLKLDPAIATKILAAQIQIQVQKGQALYAKGDRDGAMKILEVPNVASDPVAARIINRIINEKLYDRLMKEAQDMFDKGDYVGARRIYRGINKKVDNGIIGEAKLKEATRMRNVCDYEHSMSLTRQALRLDTINSMKNALGHVGGAYSAARDLRRPRGDAIKLLEKVRDKILTMDPETNEPAKELLDRVNQTLEGYKSTIGNSR